MREARMRQALKQLETRPGRISIEMIAWHLLVACGFETSEDNVALIIHELTSHVAQFAPVLDNLPLE